MCVCVCVCGSFDETPPLGQSDGCTLTAAYGCNLANMLPVFPTGRRPVPPHPPTFAGLRRAGAGPGFWLGSGPPRLRSGDGPGSVLRARIRRAGSDPAP